MPNLTSFPAAQHECGASVSIQTRRVSDTLKILHFGLMTIGEHEIKKFTIAGDPKSDRMAQVASEILRDLYESTGFSIADAAPIHERSHINYAKHILTLTNFSCSRLVTYQEGQ
jgi:hypothetical protein